MLNMEMTMSVGADTYVRLSDCGPGTVNVPLNVKMAMPGSPPPPVVPTALVNASDPFNWIVVGPESGELASATIATNRSPVVNWKLGVATDPDPPESENVPRLVMANGDGLVPAKT